MTAWEDKLESCEHALCLDQDPMAPQLAAKSLSSCQSYDILIVVSVVCVCGGGGVMPAIMSIHSSMTNHQIVYQIVRWAKLFMIFQNRCDVSTALWLCMTCGALGCSRKNFDGTGGNGHAVAHFEATGHPLVCKMGTITPEGQADLYCYACDDARLDEQLATHLATFGLNVADQTKTTKTMAELVRVHLSIRHLVMTSVCLVVSSSHLNGECSSCACSCGRTWS
jgi:hypothetical protein